MPSSCGSTPAVSVPRTRRPSRGAQFAGPLHRGDHDGGGPVRVEAGVPGGDGAAGGKHRREPRQHRRGQARGAGRRRHRPSGAVRPGHPGQRDDLGVEEPGRGGRQGAPVAAQRQGVLPFPADAEAGGHVFGGHPHVRIAEARRRELRPAKNSGAPSLSRRARSGAVLMLSTPPARYTAAAAGRHEPGRQHDRVEPGPALPVHREAGDADGQAGLEGREPGHVPAAAHGVADHHIRHRRRGHARCRRAGGGARGPAVRGRAGSSGRRWRGRSGCAGRR